MKRVVSLSGGKDSTAMLLMMIEKNIPFDEIVFFDTGWEFPQMIKHIDKLEKYIDMPVTRLKPIRSFEYWMFDRKVKKRSGENKGEIHRVGNGWPSPMRRWCTREKVSTMDKYLKNETRCIGIAADEINRTNSISLQSAKYDVLYPLVDFDLTEADCLKLCYQHGLDWGGLYEIFNRVSCFCCPLQPLSELRKLRKHFPELWEKMKSWEKSFKSPNVGFKQYDSVHDLEKRFAAEDYADSLQMKLFKAI